MLFRRLVFCALLTGLCGGLVHSVLQRWQVVPLIAAAEVFEAAAAPHEEEPHEHHDHGHDDSPAWEPQDGWERTTWTVVANVLSGTGYALLLLPLMTVWDHRRGGGAASWRSGALWGAAAWVALFAWPALGLPPELPGTAAADLHARQTWWLLAALSCAGALAVTLLGARRWGARRWLGLALLALPFAIGAPHHEGALFPGQDAAAAAQLQALTAQFVTATALATAVYWLVLGAVGGAVVARWLRPLLPGALPALAAARAGAEGA